MLPQNPQKKPRSNAAGLLAEKEGFEPPVPAKVRLISNQVLSTTQPLLRIRTYFASAPEAPKVWLKGGETGIRTPDTLLAYTHFPGVLLKPLGHLSLHFLKAGANIRTG